MDFTHPERPVPLQLVAGAGHYETVVKAVQKAERSVWIATANLKEMMVEPRRGKRYRSILRTFDELAEKGVELRILHAGIPSKAFRRTFDRHRRLVKGGLELRLCPRVHFKTVIVDGTLLYLGSANWTGAGLGAKGSERRNFELGIVTRDDGVLDAVQGMYDRIWRGEECASCRRRDVCPAPIA